MSKDKKKSKHDLPSLDFVTTLSMGECRERLLIMNRVFDDSRQIDIEGEQDFYVAWLFRHSWAKTESWIANLIDLEHYVAHLVACRMTYWGTLAESGEGTRVQLIPSREAAQYVARRVQWSKPLNTIGVVVWVVLAVFGGLFRNHISLSSLVFAAPVLLFVLLMLLIFGPLVYLINVQLQLSHRTRGEIEQIYDALYMPQTGSEAVMIQTNEAQQIAAPRAYWD